MSKYQRQAKTYTMENFCRDTKRVSLSLHTEKRIKIACKTAIKKQNFQLSYFL